MEHLYVNSNPEEFDSNCLVCRGKNRDAIHHAQLFRNKHFMKRDYESTNVVACISALAPDENWIPTTHEQLNAMLSSPVQPLWIENGVQYYGYL